MNIIDFFKTFGELTDEEINFVMSFFIFEEIKKGTFYLKEGQISNKVSFVEKGLFRLFYQLNGEEKIMLFFSESQLMSDYFGFLTNTVSIRPIQALEDSLIYSIEKKNLDKLFVYSKNWERIGRQLAESAYVTSVLRANRLLHDDFNTRVKTFIEESPSLMQRVPQYMIASYLNMTPETLSRVKRRIMKAGVVKRSLIAKAVEEKQLGKTSLRMLLDRIYSKKTGFQLFGSQVGVPFSDDRTIEEIKLIGIGV